MKQRATSPNTHLKQTKVNALYAETRVTLQQMVQKAPKSLKFVEMTPMQRFQTLRSKNCYQCLYPGANQNTGKHNEERCQRDFACKHSSHNFTNKKHVFVCEDHKSTQGNIVLLEHYKSRCISRNENLPEHSKLISVFHATVRKTKNLDDEENAIYLLQTVKIDGQNFTISFDTGCSDFVCRNDVIARLGTRCKLIQLGGVANTISQRAISSKANLISTPIDLTKQILI